MRQPPLDPAALDEWWIDRGASSCEEDTSAVDFSAEGGAAGACGVLSAILGVRVVAPGVPPAETSAPGSSTNHDPGPPIQAVLVRGAVTDRVLDAVVRSRFSPGRLKGRPACVELAACHARAVAMSNKDAQSDQSRVESDGDGPITAAAAAALTRRVRAKLARITLSQLEDDGDDLYFEGGRHRGDFLRALGAGAVSVNMLEDMLDATRTEKAGKTWVEVVRGAFTALAAVPLDAVEENDAPTRALELLTRAPRVLRALAQALVLEAGADGASATDPPGTNPPSTSLLGSRRAETPGVTVLGPALGRNALPMLRRDRGANHGAAGRLASNHGAPGLFTRLPRYPACPPGDREKLGWIVQRGVKTTHDAIHGVLLKTVRQKGACMEAVLAWLAAATRANDRRNKGGAVTHRSGAFGDPAAPTDNLAVGIAAVALRFARPVVDGADRLVEQRLMDLDPLRRNWRHDWAAETTLSRRPRKEEEEEAAASRSRSGETKTKTNAEETAPPSFVAETFYGAMRAMQVGLLPAVRRFEEATEVLRQRALAATAAGGDAASGGGVDGGPSNNKASHPLAMDEAYNAYFDCASTALLDPEVAGDASRFALLQAAWLTRLARLPPEAAADAFDMVPETCVTSMAGWVCFVLRMGKAELLLDGGRPSARPVSAYAARPTSAAPGGMSETPESGSVGWGGGGLPVVVLVQCAVELLSRPRLVRHPTVHAALVDMLQHMLIGERGRGGGGGGLGLGVRGSSTHELLVASVLGTPEAKAALCPALIRAYSVMDAVEGLDVDRDAFDKFHTRYVIACLLEELWRVEECVESVARLGEGKTDHHRIGDDDRQASEACGGNLFADFAGCVLGDLMYVLQDALDRLVSVGEMQRARADEDAWARLPQHERAEKERFLKGQERAAKGFLRNAKKTLQLLNLLASSPTVAPAFLAPEVAGKAAYAAVHFLEVLLGPKCASLKVEHPKSYGFDPKQLVLAIVEFTARLDGVPGGRWVAALAAEEDFDAAVMERARDLLVTHTFGAAVLPPKLRAIIDAVRATLEGDAPSRQTTSDGQDRGRGPGANQPTGETEDAWTEAGAGDADALMAALGTPPEEGAEWEATYKAVMGGPPRDGSGQEGRDGGGTFRSFGEADGGEAIKDFFSPFNQMCAADDAGGVPSRAKAKKLAREAAALSAGQLPCEVGSAVFLRHDPDRLDRMRAVITGPEGTPYSGGCFVFDVYFPAGYPEKPPMVNLDTTGGGRVRFNPNLYADGKVCLSLLGTWHGGGVEEKWDAKTSTLYQVLVSIQGLILVDDPMFNEPGFDGIRGTAEGDAKSREHNEEIRLYTVRHAMIAHLKHPRSGVTDVLRSHFRLQRHRIMRQVLTWCEEAKDPTTRTRMWTAARELAALLAANAAQTGPTTDVAPARKRAE